MVADIADAAAALARAGQHGVVVPPGRDRPLVEALLLSALRLPPSCLARLQRLGLQRVVANENQAAFVQAAAA